MTTPHIDKNTIEIEHIAAASVTTPSANQLVLFANTSNSDHISIKDSTATVTDLQTTASTSFADNTFFVTDNGDATKKIAFEASGITAGTTRTLTAPNFDGTIATLAGTETLTNKTLTSPAISGGTINNTPIGATTPNTLAGTSLFVAPSGSIDASAVAQADSTTKGWLPPRMTTTQRDAVSSPANGLTIYDSTLHRPSHYVNSNWMPQSIFTIKPWTSLGSDQASISITLPAIFNEAWIRLNGRSDYGTGTIDNLLIQFNSDTTAANYYNEYGTDVGATPASGEFLGSVAGIDIGLALPCNTATAGFGSVLIKVINYLSTSQRRAVTWDGTVQQGTSTGLIRAIRGGGFWQNTANAITTVVLKPALGSNLKQNSSYAVLGVF